MSPNPSDPLTGRLDALETRLAARFPEMHAALRPPATDEQLDRFEAEFGYPLPAEFRTLYRWHDGSDPVGKNLGADCLPGIGRWYPLVMLPTVCRRWEAVWWAGFEHAWIPISEFVDCCFAVDASGRASDPAAVRFFSLDQMLGQCESVAEMVEQMIGMIDSGSFAIDPVDGHGGVVTDPDPKPSLFAWSGTDLDSLDQEPLRRFALRRRSAPSSDHSNAPDTDANIATVAVDDLLAVLLEHGGRDVHQVQIELESILGGARSLSYESRSDGAVTSTMAILLLRLDELWRILEQNVDPALWRDTWLRAERAILSFDIDPDRL